MKPNLKMSIKQALHRGTLLFFWIAILVILAAQVMPVSAAAGCPPGKHCIYVPLTRKSVVTTNNPTLDLIATGVEVNQAIQNESNSIPLVAGRGTMLRIFTKVSGSSQAVTGVRVSITAARGGNTLASAPTVLSATVPLNSSRGDLQSSVNFPLPAQWLAGTVDLSIRIDADNRLAEANEDNNTIVQRLVFNDVPALNVKIVPVQYAHQGSGAQHIYPAPTEDTVSDWVRRTFPVSQVNVSWHAPYAFSGNLSTTTDFNRLLNEITALKSSESAPSSTVYYALVPTVDGNSSWFYGGIAGIGWIGNRVSVGIDLVGSASQIAAHEIGHNLGMGHTPCGVSSSETSYPYGDGSIGQYGLDIYSGTLYAPSSKDVMSYCNPKWISDYTYKVLYNSQLKYGAYVVPSMEGIQSEDGQEGSASGSNNTLMIRASIGGASVEMLPTYFFTGQKPTGAAGGAYTVQLIGADETVVAEQPVQATAIELEAEEELEGIHALIPAPDAAVKAVRLLKDGVIIAEQLAQGGLETPVTVEATTDGYRLQWDGAEIPALIRYSADGGATWTTLGVDVTGGTLDVSGAVIPSADGIFQAIPAYAVGASN